jgi:bifunctional non-homologous end joining protein LigD
MPVRKETLALDGREVMVTNPDKVFFPRTGHTKLDLVRYYVAVADGALRGVAGRPMALKRFVNGAEGEAFFQKRAPKSRPSWIETVQLSFPSGRTADEVVVRDVAALVWVVNLGCIDLNPHPVRADDLDHPDELRIDLDPVPGVGWDQIRQVALVTKEVLADHGLTGWPKTSGSRGFHIYARIERRWPFQQVRRAAVALAREVERRAPDLATSKWWKEERHGVFLDYNQNAKDRTVASAYSVRPTPDARVSTPLRWEEVPDCEPEAFTIETVPERFARLGDVGEGIDQAAGSLESLLELAARDEASGLRDAPWPPHYEKQADEPRRVQPSKRRPDGREGAVPPPAPGKTSGPTGRRRTRMPLIEIARAASQAEAMEGLERWKQRYPDVWPRLAPADVLVDSMRGRSSTWTRIRLNLRNVPEPERPVQERLEVDYDPWTMTEGAAVDSDNAGGGIPDDSPAIEERSGETVDEAVEVAADGTAHRGVERPPEDAVSGESPVEQASGDPEMTGGRTRTPKPPPGAAVSGGAQSMPGARTSDRVAGDTDDQA